MRAVEFDGQNCMLSPPTGHDNSNADCKIGVLPVMTTVFDDGTPGIVSIWRPDEQELKALFNGAHIRLCVLGVSHPPVALDVIDGVEELP